MAPALKPPALKSPVLEIPVPKIQSVIPSDTTLRARLERTSLPDRE
jgi:hypothetical protein